MSDLDDLLAQVDTVCDDIVRLAQDLVRIPSINTGVMPTGNETPVCEFAKDWLNVDGIDSEILESTHGRGNLISGIAGTSGKSGLMFMSHVDVVPVEDESKWRFPPFSATVHDGRIYGRGVADCKGLLASQMMAMRLLVRNRVKLEDSLILASGADEEHGGRYGFGWLSEYHPEKITAPFAVNEGGGTPMEAAGGRAYLLGIGEKGRLQIEITMKGSSAHASIPWKGNNALYALAQTLENIQIYEAERDTSNSFFDYLATFAIEHKPSSENIDEIIGEVESDNQTLGTMLRALSRMTLTPTIVSGGVKSNSVPESVTLTCDVRTLPHQGKDYVKKEITRILESVPGVEFEIDYMAVANSSPYQTDFVSSIKVATERALGRADLQWVPGISTGFTDSRFTRQLGVDTYGFEGTHPDDDHLIKNVHGTDESESIRSLICGTKIMLALAYNVLAAK